MTYRTASLVAVLTAACLGSACSKAPQAAAGTAASAAATAAPAPAATPVQGQSEPLTGKVLETMDAASYTYVRLGTAKGDVWIAASQFPIKVGDELSVVPEMPMENFHSKALNRDFPLIYFVSSVGANGNPTAPPKSAGMMSSHGTNAAPVVEVGKIDPPADGMAIADVWAKRDALSGKTVTVRGKVVKYNAQIMGVNWLHIQDGSGTAKDQTNDLTVTSSDTVQVGDVVTVTGTLATKKDFGAGYAYDVMVEKASIRK